MAKYGSNSMLGELKPPSVGTMRVSYNPRNHLFSIILVTTYSQLDA
jgi:hypothetical protein